MLNQKSFINKVDSIYKAKKNTGCFLLIYMDISEFQFVNRYYGIEKGDILLHAIETLLNSIPEIVAFERVFSDHFVALAFTTSECTKDIIISTYKDYETDFLSEQKKNYPACNLKISCGIYVLEEDDISDAIDLANLARKAAKRNGSCNAVVFDRAMLNEISVYREKEEATNLALQEKRFTFFLQPKVNLLTGEIIGAEALARRIDKNGNIVFPDSFFRILEDNGAIVELDTLILEQVCAYISDRLKKGLPVVRTSVNLSRLHIQNSNAADNFHSIVQKYHVPPEYIEFELTETILLNEFEGAKLLIDRLRGFQYHVSIDDFGAGYAGINIWQELNFDILKLDKKFLAEEEPIKSRNAAIVPNVINIAQRLGIEVLCEGVETEEQCQYLMKLGCTCVQGYYFSRPVPKEQFYQTYKEQNGHYACPFSKPDFTSDLPSKSAKKSIFHGKAPQHVLMLSLCSLFLAICVTLTLGIYYRSGVTNIFMDSTNRNLESHSSGQSAIIHARIDDVISTLTAFSTLIEHEDNNGFIDTYIAALNESEPEITFLFSTAEEFDKRIEQGDARTIDVEYIERLKRGEVVLSDITFSELAGNIYCFSIGVPVFSDGEFIGGLRAIVNADILVDAEHYLSPYGTVENTFVIDNSGKILLANKDMNALQAGDIKEYISALQLSNDASLKLQEALSNESIRTSFRLGEANGIPYYASIIPLDYNNWKTVVIFKANEIGGIINSLFRYTVVSSFGLMVAILVISILVTLYLLRWNKKIDIDTERYLLLEEFSDTVLFDYDKGKDIIRFTPNARQLFDVQELTYRGFLEHLEQLPNIHPTDYAAVKEILLYQSMEEKGEVRIRLKHPSDGHFYWYLVQYKYMHSQGRGVSIIGKIVNIDEQQKHEEALIKQTMRDGLTELYNKSASEYLIQQCLEEDKSGLLFMIDIDDFKKINDTHGHPEGDYALQYISRCLKRTFRSYDIIGRIGGDELLIYMRKINSPSLVHKKMQIFWERMCEHSKQNAALLTVSVGIVSYPDDGQSFEDLYKKADQLMYNAKLNGKQRYCFEGQIYRFDTVADKFLGGEANK